MSNNIPPRRPTQPIIRGPRPVTTKLKPKSPSETPEKPVSEPKIEATAAPVAAVSNPAPAPVPAPTPVQTTGTAEANTTQTSNTSNVAQPKRITTKPSPKPTKANTNKERSGVDPIKIILLVLVLMLGGVVGYLAYDKLKVNKEFAAQAEINENSLQTFKSDIDLKVEEITRLQDSLRTVITEKESLGLALTQEQARIAELEGLKEQVRKKQLSIIALNAKLKESRLDAENAKNSVGNLAAENQRLVTEKVRLERLVQEKIDSIANISVKQAVAVAEAAPKPAKTVEIKADGIQVIVYNTGGKEMKNPRAMMAGKIKASLNISATSSNSETGSQREIFLRVIEPSGNTLYSGNKSFEADGKQIVYTEKQTIEFNNTKQRITFYYDKGSRYTPGRYSVEIWSDAKKIGQSEFVLQK